MSKYQNPINKPETVTIPRWEYARLLEAKTILATIRLLVENDKSYDATTLLKLLVENDKSYDATTLLKLMIDNENKMEG